MKFNFASSRPAEALTAHILQTSKKVDFTCIWENRPLEIPQRVDFFGGLSLQRAIEQFSPVNSEHLLIVWYVTDLQMGSIRISRSSISLSSYLDEWRVKIYFCLYRQVYRPNITKLLHEFALETRSEFGALTVEAFSPAGNHEPSCIFKNEETGPKWKTVENVSPLLFEPWTAPFKKKEGN